MIDKHIFSLFYENINDVSESDQYIIKDSFVVHRISNVLRLLKGDCLYLFNKQSVVFGKILAINKKEVIVITKDIKKVTQPLPPITLFQCLTKKSTFEEILYVAASLGVTTIVPVISNKVHKNWFLNANINRLHKIIISACEQAKNFFIPSLLTKAITFSEIESNAHYNILFDTSGNLLGTFFYDICKKNNAFEKKRFSIFIGPEGGITSEEKEVLFSKGFGSFCIVPSVLRVREAVTVGLGIIRSMTQ
jgi:16S rRNA (uracil1498-N3)-methyltransferase